MPLATSSADYRTIIESAPEAIIVYAAGRFLYLNPFASARLGAGAESLVGKPIMDFVHPESVELVVTRISQLEKTAQAGPPVEVRFVARDGTVIPAEVVSVPIVFEGQKAILGLIRDISGRVETERALRESEERFGNAFRYSPHGMAFVSLEGRWMKVNKSLCEMVGYSEEELLARTFKDITHPDDLPDDLEQLRLLKAGKINSYTRVKRYYTKDGRLIWISLAVSAVRDASGEPMYFIGQVQDVTRQRASEAEAAHARWVAGIGETAIAVAHEMNNALTILLMNAELLANEASPEEIPEMATEVLSSANRIAATVERLRQLADPKSIDYVGEKKMLDLSSRASQKASQRS